MFYSQLIALFFCFKLIYDHFYNFCKLWALTWVYDPGYPTPMFLKIVHHRAIFMKESVHIYIDKNPPAWKLIGALGNVRLVWVDDGDVADVKGYGPVLDEKGAATF